MSEKDIKLANLSSADELGSKEAINAKDLGSHEVISLDDEENFGIARWDEERVKAYYNSLDGESVNYFLEKTGHGRTLEDKDRLTPDLYYLLDKLMTMTDERTLTIFEKTIYNHSEDVNFQGEDWELINDVIDGKLDFHNDPFVNFKARLTATLIYYHSPYPDVRAVTDAFNDPDEPVETIRIYVISIIWTIIASGVNEFFSHRQPSIKLYSPVIAVLMYPCGKAWEKIIPNVMIPWFGRKIPLNPGPYTYKEQMFGTVFSGVSATSVYVSYNIVTQKMFYQQEWMNFGFQVTLTLSTQCMGLAFAGIMRKFVIYPERAMWPTQLPTLAMNRALLSPERKENIHGWKITKYNFFWITFIVMFVYFWLPDYLFQALSTFNWMTWIAPNNFNLAVVTGMSSGLGLNPVPTFDWNVVTSLGLQPLATPFNTMLNVMGGCLVGMVIILALFYQNVQHTGYLPINSNSIFTNTGEKFQVTKVLTNGLLDVEKYQAYSPPFYTASNLVVYGAFFLVYPFTFMYNSFKEWKTIYAAFKMIHANMMETVHDFTFKTFFKSASNDYSKFDDAHSKMMARYKEVPDWYYFCILLVSFALSIACVEGYKESKTPVWGIFFVIGINFIFLIPFSVLFAVTGAQLGLNVLVELIIGYAIPGNGTALMTLKAYGYNIDGQADNFVSSLKLGHYAKLPPRAVFRAQIIGTLVQAFVFLGVCNWSMSNIENFCSPTQSSKFTCPSERTYYSASVFWGVIGPKLVFSGIYPVMKYCFLIGFLLGIIFVAMKVLFDKKKWYKTFALFEPTVFIFGILNTFAPYNLSYVIPTFYFSLGFMWYIRKRYVSWFEKYNYVFSAALGASIAFSAIIIFFAVQYHPKTVSWWGNNVPYAGIDGGNGQQTLLDVTLTPRGYFGPEKGHYPLP